MLISDDHVRPSPACPHAPGRFAMLSRLIVSAALVFGVFTAPAQAQDKPNLTVYT